MYLCHSIDHFSSIIKRPSFNHCYHSIDFYSRYHSIASNIMPATTHSMAQKSLYIDNPLSTSNTNCLTTFACTTELLSKPAMEKSQGNITTDCFVHHGDNT
jgi:hypothetical protein